EESLGLEFFAAQADHQGSATQVGMQANVAQRLDGDLRAGSVDSHAAPIGVGNGDNIIDVAVAREDLGLDTADGIVDGGGDALHGGGDAQDILGAGGAVGVAVTLEGVAFERRERSRDGSSQGELVKRRSGGKVEKLRADPEAAANGPVRVTNDLAIASDRLAAADVLQRD